MIGAASTAAIGGLGLLSASDRERIVYLVIAVTLLVIGYVLVSSGSETGGQTEQEPEMARDDDPDDPDVPLFGGGESY